MHIICAADFPLCCSNLLENALFCQQNALLKSRLIILLEILPVEFIQAYWGRNQQKRHNNNNNNFF